MTSNSSRAARSISAPAFLGLRVPGGLPRTIWGMATAEFGKRFAGDVENGRAAPSQE